jgi:hypothetical protein
MIQATGWEARTPRKDYAKWVYRTESINRRSIGRPFINRNHLQEHLSGSRLAVVRLYFRIQEPSIIQ